MDLHENIHCPTEFESVIQMPVDFQKICRDMYKLR